MKKDNIVKAAVISAILAAYLLLIIRIAPQSESLYFFMPLAQIINLACIIFFLALSLKHIVPKFKVAKSTLLMLAIVFLIALILRGAISPRIHRINYDEDIYLNIGQTIATNGQACMCEYGTPNHCELCIDNKQPSAWSSVLSIFFKVFGADEGIAYFVSLLLNSLTILLVFGIAYILFESESISLYSSLAIALIRTHIEWSSTTSSDGISLFFNAFAAFSMLIYMKKQTFATQGLFFSAIAFAAQIRPESFLIIAICGIYLLLNLKSIMKDAFAGRTIFFIALALMLMLPNLLHIKINSDQPWGADSAEERFSLKHMVSNTKSNLSYFIENGRIYIILTIFSVIGLLRAIRLQFKNFLFLSGWFLLYFMIFAAFYAGSFNYGMDVRFALNLFVPFSLFFGLGLDLFEKVVSKIVKRYSKTALNNAIITITMCQIVMLLAYPTMQNLSDVKLNSYDSMLSHDFIIGQIGKMPNNSIIVTHVPTMILMNGGNAFQSNKIFVPELASEIFQKYDNIYFYEGFWCLHDRAQKMQVCKYIKDNFKLYPINSIKNNVNPNNYKYTLYKMVKK